MHSPHGTQFSFRDVPGFATVADLFAGDCLTAFSVVWRLAVERFIDTDFELRRRMILDLGESFDLDSRPLIRLTMVGPRECSIPDCEQIMGLAIEDLRPAGMEGIRYRVYDYESTDFDVICSRLELSRVRKPEYQ